MVTVGGVVSGVGPALDTLTPIEAEVPTLPAPSMALAVMVWVPDEILFTFTLVEQEVVLKQEVLSTESK